MLSRFFAGLALCFSFAERLGGTPEALAAFLKAEQDKWGRVIRDLGIKLQ